MAADSSAFFRFCVANAASLAIENLLLRQQLAALKEINPRAQLTPSDRASWNIWVSGFGVMSFMIEFDDRLVDHI